MNTVKKTQTFALIKSGPLARGDQWRILSAITDAGFDVVRMTLMKPMQRDAAERLYSDHAGKPYFEGLIGSVTGHAGAIALVLASEGDAVAKWRAAMGATDPKAAAPGSLRSQFGGLLPDNALHGSDSAEAAERESDTVFGSAVDQEHPGLLARLALHDWDNDQKTLCARGVVQVSRSVDGIDLDFEMPDTTTDPAYMRSMRLEIDRGALRVLGWFSATRDGPMIDAHVDRRGVHLYGAWPGGSSTLIPSEDGDISKASDWEPAPGPEFDLWVGPWIRSIVNGHRVRALLDGPSMWYEILGEGKRFTTLEAATSHAKNLPRGPHPDPNTLPKAALDNCTNPASTRPDDVNHQ